MASCIYSNVVSYSDGLPGEGRGIPYFYLTTLDPTARDALEDERASFTLSEFPLGTCGKIDPENPTCAKLTLTGKRVFGVGNGLPEQADEGRDGNLLVASIHLLKEDQDAAFQDGGGAAAECVVWSILIMATVEPVADEGMKLSLRKNEMWRQNHRSFFRWEGRCLVAVALSLKLVDLQSSEAEFAKSALFTKHPEMKDWPKNHHFKIFKLEIENIFLIDWFGGAKPITPSQYLEFRNHESVMST
ncbi:hypothetical protein U9M48_029149 [Paspalum notatum var. saurae]|uniref:CREG-like beta-barrel domain-containing protein n=1 Tax=Paspalum notatum var. saurae TaxID=547442 RepID=A0AAQ3TXU3_PASNO